ncbi:hypothetical protein N7527_007171 [Penicillium freii]|nr:hypothetical protein N7527_007171 [Penicillium freii]
MKGRPGGIMASSQLHAPWDDGGYTSGDHETQHDDSDSFDSEDYDGNDPDYSDSEHNNSEESSEYDFCNNNFEDDSEYDLGYNNSENGSEYSYENDDEELIPRMQDIPDHGISSDVEDLVFEEEEEGIHDELEAEEYNDGSDTNALQPQMHNPFRPAYSFSNLQQEPKSIRVDRFGRRFESAVRFLVRKAQETDWSQRNTQEAWVHIGFKHPVGKSSPDMIMEIFRNVIPESTMAILGHTHVTYEHIMTLPTVDFSSNLPGVYLIAFAPSIHQQHQVHYGHFGNFTTPIGQQRQVPDTCYAGSSTVDISMRCHEHMQHFHDIDAAELHRRQSQPNRKSTMYLYKVAGTFGLVPTYLEIARFPEHLEEIGHDTSTGYLRTQ